VDWDSDPGLGEYEILSQSHGGSQRDTEVLHGIRVLSDMWTDINAKHAKDAKQYVLYEIASICESKCIQS
jgi:hypothetical protein